MPKYYTSGGGSPFLKAGNVFQQALNQAIMLKKQQQQEQNTENKRVAFDFLKMKQNQEYDRNLKFDELEKKHQYDIELENLKAGNKPPVDKFEGYDPRDWTRQSWNLAKAEDNPGLLKEKPKEETTVTPPTPNPLFTPSQRIAGFKDHYTRIISQFEDTFLDPESPEYMDDRKLKELDKPKNWKKRADYDKELKLYEEAKQKIFQIETDAEGFLQGMGQDDIRQKAAEYLDKFNKDSSDESIDQFLRDNPNFK